MSKDPNKRQVRIFNPKTGEVRFSEPVPVQAARGSGDGPALPEPTTEAGTEPSTVDAAANQASTSPGPDGAPAAPESTEPSSPVSESKPVASVMPDGQEPASTADAKHSGASKPKADIETLEQFVAYAYGRKGQRVTLKPKIERQIAQAPRLDEAALERLHAIADGDHLLAVPRQLLLVSREVEGLPALRAAISEFVSGVMLRHPAFVDSGVRAAVRNLPEAPSPAEALTRTAGYTPGPAEGKDGLKPAELQALRLNATYLLATWLASTRGLNFEELATLLFQALWAPAARDLADDHARLRELTELAQPAGVGLACDRFRQRAVEARAAQDHATREAASLRERVAALEAQRTQAELERDTALADLQALTASSAEERAALVKQHDVQRTHLRHELEQLRGRLVRRLGDSVDMLEVGLTALRNKTPRTEVMIERAEHVIDALRAEESNLRED